MKKIILLGFIILFECIRTTSASDVPEEFKEFAKKDVPLKADPYTLDELQKKFKSVMMPAIQADFTTYLTIMFSDKFPKPPHPNNVIVGGWQCMYGKMLYAMGFADPEKVISYQREALFVTLALHKKVFEGIDAALAAKIKSFPCDSCRRTAKLEMGIEHDGYAESPSAKPE
jgi:hypothetical protein